MEAERIGVGKIIGIHGVRGDVKVLPLTDFPERFRPGTRLILEQESAKGREKRTFPVTVISARPSKGNLILKLAEINDADQAGAVRGATLKVEPWEVEPLPEGHYYIYQLLGSRVYTTGGEFLGTLQDILVTGANDVYVVRNEEAGEILIPALKTVVRQVDLARKEIRVELPPGLRD
ncbi:ribosome maturation factor RimM [Moorella thermoacetica]|uniref:Ribosome maturation factor RimM n=1 Tax=Neomoorella thermoacetica TaxID=1525 RepID=A0A1J5P7N9_NEOTH|nr:ribosome maturation factor RimM [Moorella thermoacetica]